MNFTNGIPLMINFEKRLAIFAKKCAFNDHTINLLSDFQSDSVIDYSLFIFESLIKSKYLGDVMLSLLQLIKKITRFTLFGINFTDELADNIVECLAEFNAEYFLISDSGVKSNLFRQSSVPSNHFTDFLGNDICEEIFSMFCKWSFGDVNHIVQLDISAYPLMPFCIRLLVDHLQHCSVEKIIIHNLNNLLGDITEVILDAYCTGTQIKNFIEGIPLAIFGLSAIKEVSYLCITVLFSNYNMNKAFDKVLANLLLNETYTHLQCVFLNMFKTIEKYLSKFLTRNSNSIILYEVSMQNKMTEKTLNFLSAKRQAWGILASQNMLSAFGVSAHLALKTLFNIAYKSTLSPLASPNDGLNNTESISFDKLRYFTKVFLSKCSFDISKDKKFGRELFTNKSVIPYIIKFDVSNCELNYYSVCIIIEVLKYCIIENLIVPGDVWSEVSKNVLQSAFNRSYNFLNFIKGTPLILVGSFGLKDNIIMVLVVNSDVNRIIDKVMDLSEYDVNLVNIFMISCHFKMKYLSIIFPKLRHWMQTYENLAFIATGLIDEVAVCVAEFFNETDQPSVDYCLISDTKLLSNKPSTLPIERWFASERWFINDRWIANPDIGNFIGEELFGIFCELLSAHPLPTRIPEVDISAYQLSSKCVECLVQSLQHCCIKRLLIYNYGNKLAEVNDLILEAHLNGKILQNSLSGIPITVIAHTTKSIPIEIWVTLYFVDCIVAQNFKIFLIDLKNDIKIAKLACVFLNFFTKNNGIFILHHNYFSKLLIDCCINIFIYEVDMADKMAVKVKEYLKSL